MKTTILKLLFCALYLCTLKSEIWLGNVSPESFEIELQRFRFGLYEQIKPPKQKFNYEAYFTPGLILAIKQFQAKNTQNILNYRLYILERYESPAPDLSAYELWKNIPVPIDPSAHLKKGIPPFWTYHPQEHMELFSAAYLPRWIKTEEYARYAFKNAIARALFLSQRLERGEWRIWLHKYDYVFEYRYVPKTAKISEFKVWRLQKKHVD